MSMRAHVRRSVAVAAALAMGAVLTASAARAQQQTTRTDPRWTPWLGCWEPPGARAANDSAGAQTVCVIPVADSPAVDIATIAGGQITHRERVSATGRREASTEGGCTGWKSATWSSDGLRLYLRSEATCTGNVERRTSGMFAISPTGRWLDIESVASGGSTAMRVVRYVEAPVPAVAEHELAPVVGARSLAVSTARSAASAAATPGAVVDAAHHVDASVVQAWLVERHDRLAVNGKELVKLANAGVPGSVIDVMVALSYPDMFSIASSGSPVRAAPGERSGAEGYAEQGNGTVIPVYMNPYGYSPCDWGYCAGFGYLPFGYLPFGYGWYGGGPIIVVPARGKPATAHGKVIKGRGYSRGTQPSASPSGTGGIVESPRGTRTAHGTGASSSGASSRGSSSSGSTSSGATTRTAKPRP
ncbi:MAG: hypothetical protein IRY91_07510 [Gemmatimonadaceae bacterium]|nr:hypothetical protein [Gemmatimonadaceae bacterium]